MNNSTSHKPTNWILTEANSKDWGPDGDIYEYTDIPDDKQCIPLYPTDTIDVNIVLILLCFDTSKSKLKRKNGCDIYLRGITDFENALRAVDTVTNINNIE